MDRRKFPGLTQMTMSEVKVFAKSLVDDGYTPEEALEYIEGIDRCLTIQASASIINRFVGKAKWNKKTARQLLFDTAMQIPIPERFLNNPENE